MKKLIAILIIAFSTQLMAEEKINYEYKKYDRFDLGNLEVDGRVIAPGDISVRQRARNRIKREINQRDNFLDLMKEEVKYQR
jgi:hypothetical protein